MLVLFVQMFESEEKKTRLSRLANHSGTYSNKPIAKLQKTFSEGPGSGGPTKTLHTDIIKNITAGDLSFSLLFSMTQQTMIATRHFFFSPSNTRRVLIKEKKGTPKELQTQARLNQMDCNS